LTSFELDVVQIWISIM